MAVYREGYAIVEEIQKQSIRIFEDACDNGVPVKEGDKIWNYAKQLVEWYGIKGTRQQWTLGVQSDIQLIDEWAVSDERKTLKEATETYRVSYCKSTIGKCEGFDGFISVERLIEQPKPSPTKPKSFKQRQFEARRQSQKSGLRAGVCGCGATLKTKDHGKWVGYHCPKCGCGGSYNK